MIQEINLKLEKTIEQLNQELRSLRLGRASAGLVEGVTVEAYNSQMKLVEMASITIPQHNQILIQPWDVELLIPIQQALQKLETQLNPVTEGNLIRITIPPLTEERRKELAKDMGKFGEQARISMRNIREEGMKDIDEDEINKEISEDEKFKQKENLQKLIDKYNKKIQDLISNKEKEILE